MCFAPQRRALFRHLNWQKWSETWCVLYILTSKCASRNNGVQFFISPLASWLRTRRFSEPTFRPSGATNHWKNTVNRDFPTFSRISIFFLLTLSLLLFSLLIFLFSLPLPCSAFHLSILSEVWLLNFFRYIDIDLYIYNVIYDNYIMIYIYYIDCDMFLKNMIWFDWVAMLPQRFTVLRGMELIDVHWPRQFAAVEKERSRKRPMDCNFDPQIPWFSSMFNHFQSFFMAFLGRKVGPLRCHENGMSRCSFGTGFPSLCLAPAETNMKQATKSNQRFQMAKLGSPKIYEYSFL